MKRVGELLWCLVQRAGIAKGKSLSEETKRYVGGAVLVVAPVLFVSRLAAAVLVAGVVAKPIIEQRTKHRIRMSAIERDMPVMVDLFRVAIASGLNVPMSTSAVADAMHNPWNAELRFALVQIQRGRRTADALEDVVSRTTEAARPLFGALASSERYGSPLSVLLERVAHEGRVDHERRVERAAKKLSLQLLFPVAGCTLPAFALLTVAPLIAGSFGTLASSFH